MDMSTVSRALNNSPRIRQSTAEKVRAKAAEMGYRPDPSLRRLTQLRWTGETSARPVSIALIKWLKADCPFRTQELIAPVRIAVESLGYGFETFCVEDYKSPAEAARLMEARGVAGLILLPSNYPSAWTGFPWARFTAIHLLMGKELPTGLSYVDQGAFRVMLDAGRRVAEARPKSAAICFFSPPSETPEGLQSYSAAVTVIEWWKKAGIACQPPRLFDGIEIMRQMAEWLAKEKVEAAIVPNAGIDAWKKPNGQPILPEKTKLIALDRRGWSDFAGYERQSDLLARRAVQYIDSLIRHGERGCPALPETILVPLLWVPGPSFPE